MQPGQKLVADDGHQVLLFPLPVMNITQTSSPSSFSHCCGHPFDCVGNTTRAPYYAPCDCRLYYTNGASVGNSRSWVSINPVHTPSGLKYVSFQFTHDNAPPYSTIGTVVRQGQLIGRTGTAGFVTGDHVHIDQASGQDIPMISSGITCSGGNLCYMLSGSEQPYDIFYINGTSVINDMGLNFQEYSGGVSPGPPGGTPSKMKFMYYLKRRW
jgi:hypothetical protein